MNQSVSLATESEHITEPEQRHANKNMSVEMPPSGAPAMMAPALGTDAVSWFCKEQYLSCTEK